MRKKRFTAGLLSAVLLSGGVVSGSAPLITTVLAADPDPTTPLTGPFQGLLLTGSQGPDWTLEGDTLTIKTNVTMTGSSITVPAGQEINLVINSRAVLRLSADRSSKVLVDLEGTLNISGGGSIETNQYLSTLKASTAVLNITNISITSTAGFGVINADNGKLNISNSAIVTDSQNLYGYIIAVSKEPTTIQINNSYLKANGSILVDTSYEGFTLTIEGDDTELISTDSVVIELWYDHASQIIIKGGTFISPNTNPTNGFIYFYDEAVRENTAVVIEGGVFNQNILDALYNPEAANLVFNGVLLFDSSKNQYVYYPSASAALAAASTGDVLYSIDDSGIKTRGIYDIQLGASFTNGTVDINGTGLDSVHALAEDEIRFTVKPGEGYELVEGSVSLETDSGEAPVLNGPEDGVYSFTMPAESVTIIASFKEINNEGGSGDTGSGDTPTTPPTTNPDTGNGGGSGSGSGSNKPTLPPTQPEDTDPGYNNGTQGSGAGFTEPGSQTQTDEKTGEQTTFTQDENGVKSATSQKPDGTITNVDVAVPSEAIKDGKVSVDLGINQETGEKIQLVPGNIADLNSAPNVNIELPENSGRVLVEIEIKPGTIVPGTVGLLNEDGKVVPIPLSVVIDGNLCIPLEGSATIVVMDGDKTYPDVDKEAWYEKEGYVAFTSSRGILNGYADGSFAPNGTVSRGMFSRILYNLFGEPETNAQIPEGVPNGTYFTDAAAWAKSKGLMASGSAFEPAQNLSREDMVLILYRVVGSPETNTSALDAYPDSKEVSGYAKAAMAWGVENKIIGQGSKLDPTSDGTRAEIAAIITRFIQSNYPELLSALDRLK